jgi:hypothetical protein
MADSTLTTLPQANVPGNTDALYIVQGGASKQVAISGIAASPIFGAATGAAILAYQQPRNIRYIGVSVDGGGSVLSTGLQAYDTIPYGGTIVNWSIDASPSGSVAFNIYKIGSGVTPPTTSIVGGVPPALGNGFFQDTTGLANWSTAVTGGDRIGWVVLSASTVTKATLKVGIQT